MPPTAPFIWHDGERTVAFGRGMLGRAVEQLGGPGYTLLTTERAAASAPAIVDAAATVHHVAGGLVEELAGALRDAVGASEGDRLVALGGGRVIDVAKALASATGARAMAVPTTLSGAEMTGSHRVISDRPRVRPAVVVCDPALAASQPVPDLAASALNALGHAFEAPCTVRANPVATLVAHDAARRIHDAFAGHPGDPDRDALALGALLAGYALGSTGIGLHHVLAQTLVRVAGIGHGPANAVLLPHTIGALAWRAPEAHAALAVALGDDPARAAARVAAPVDLAAVAVEHATLVEAAEAAAARDELAMTPPAAEAPEIRAIYEAAL